MIDFARSLNQERQNSLSSAEIQNQILNTNLRTTKCCNKTLKKIANILSLVVYTLYFLLSFIISMNSIAVFTAIITSLIFQTAFNATFNFKRIAKFSSRKIIKNQSDLQGKIISCLCFALNILSLGLSLFAIISQRSLVPSGMFGIWSVAVFSSTLTIEFFTYARQIHHNSSKIKTQIKSCYHTIINKMNCIKNKNQINKTQHKYNIPSQENTNTKNNTSQNKKINILEQNQNIYEVSKKILPNSPSAIPQSPIKIKQKESINIKPLSLQTQKTHQF